MGSSIIMEQNLGKDGVLIKIYGGVISVARYISQKSIVMNFIMTGLEKLIIGHLVSD